MTQAPEAAGQEPEDSGEQIFVQVEAHDVDHHHLRVFEPASDDWLEKVAARYRSLRTDSITPVRPLSVDGVEVVSVDRVQSMLASCVPTYRPGNFGVIRSDLAELILAAIQAGEYGCQYGYRSVRDRELIQFAGRGIDQIGAELGDRDGEVHVALVLGEAKTSAHDAHPPSVVNTSSDSLRNQHLGHLSYMQSTIDKVIDASRQARDGGVADLLRLAAVMLKDGDPRVEIIASSLVVRPSEIASAPSDFGSFYTNPDDFAPASVRFMIARLPGNVDKIAEKLGELASVGGPQ